MRWIDPHAGFTYESATVVINREQQVEKLAACGLDPNIFGDAVDPSFFIGEAIHAGINSGISAEGNVNMLQSLVMHRPALLGEPLRVNGRISAVTAVPRGRTIDTEVWFDAEDGSRVITANRRSLKPDPDKPGGRGAGERPPPVIEDPSGLEELGRFTLTPSLVKNYSREGNSIHYDVDAARQAGFRAPLIGGGQGVHYLLACLWPRYQPRTLDLDIYFRRPVFWDETFLVVMAPGAAAICIAREGKVATEARINSID